MDIQEDSACGEEILSFGGLSFGSVKELVAVGALLDVELVLMGTEAGSEYALLIVLCVRAASTWLKLTETTSYLHELVYLP